jgi:ELWxxDGT repeat protein
MQRQIVMFAGIDASNIRGLWETNGAVAGTHELTGISGAYTATTGVIRGINPGDMTLFNGEMLFEGADTSDKSGLWVTNGSAAGTHELTGIFNVGSGGLNPQDMTAFGQEVLFNGINASGQSGLWATNGTTAGTHELTGISGADTASEGLTPFDLTVFRSPRSLSRLSW